MPTVTDTGALERTQDAAVDACLELVCSQRHGVSFAELHALCECLGIATAGGAVLWATIPNLALWAGMSGEFAAICAAVYEHPSVVLRPSSAPAFDGLGVLLPAVARLPRASWPPRPSGYRIAHLLHAAFAWRTPLAGAPRPTGSTPRPAARKDHR
ncbi:hypothetical protein [Mycobacterium marinum]|uniref:hypothetical protein n=1 Tax=Mycobacterium marinum TaxID=1781 RepID=UPI00235889DF|nr:hypothetical protein [Mycobacterium marinum]MDC9006473.1 hypothetical protein [Mycobacterium marinum]